MAQRKPWYAGEHQDALYYLLIAIFFIELIVGGVAFFYGIIHAEPEVPGGPPMARFPWFAWAAAAIFSPIVMLLVVHLAGSWLQGAMTRDDNAGNQPGDVQDEHLPEGMKRFYASVRHAPTLVVLLGILLCGVALFFVEGALGALKELFHALIPYIPWLAGCGGGLLAFCFMAHALMVFRQRKMENEYAWRREVLEKTGLVLVDKSSVPLPQSEAQQALVAPEIKKIGPVLDVAAKTAQGELPPAEQEAADAAKDKSSDQDR